MTSRLLSLILSLALVASGAADDVALTSSESALAEAIHASTMKAHVSFLASDLLEGRDTPSRGLDLASEYIAAQFRRVGLEPGGADGSYFQRAPFMKVSQPMDGFKVSVALPDGGKSWGSAGPKVMLMASRASQFADLDVVKISLTDENATLPADKAAVQGKAVLLLTSQRVQNMAAKREALYAMQPAVIVTPGFLFNQPFRLRDASVTPPPGLPPVLVVSDSEFTKFAGDLPEGATAAKLSLNALPPFEEPVELRNVVAQLPGSDPALKNQNILLTAHYDHIGISPRGDGDRINNGANDDASGVSTVLALAEAFSAAKTRPRRTLIFMTYFGEEKGLLGSHYYAAHPIVPLRDTVANLNFEHMGRTDDTEGPRAGKITASGFDYTTIGNLLVETGKATGIEAWKHEKNSDAFFNRSDNQALADAGIPALTLAVAWIFPDYHRPGDHWEKLDYANLEKVVRTMAVVVQRLANQQQAPPWIESNTHVEKYLKAYRALHADPAPVVSRAP